MYFPSFKTTVVLGIALISFLYFGSFNKQPDKKSNNNTNYSKPETSSNYPSPSYRPCYVPTPIYYPPKETKTEQKVVNKKQNKRNGKRKPKPTVICNNLQINQIQVVLPTVDLKYNQRMVTNVIKKSVIVPKLRPQLEHSNSHKIYWNRPDNNLFYK